MASTRFGVLASHEGTTLQALIDACQGGAIDGQLVVAISNNSGSGALRRAREARIPTLHLSARTHPSPEALDEAILEALDSRGVEVVVLAGYMKRLGPRTLARFRGRIVNTHPSLLPRHGGPGMFGLHVHRAVLAAGDPVTGASVHLVTEEYDAGPVLGQARVAVVAGEAAEELASRVQEAERKLLVAALAGIAAGGLLPDHGSHPPLRGESRACADDDAPRSG